MIWGTSMTWETSKCMNVGESSPSAEVMYMPHLQLPRWFVKIPDKGIFDIGDTKSCNCSLGHIESWRTMMKPPIEKEHSQIITWYYYVYVYVYIYIYIHMIYTLLNVNISHEDFGIHHFEGPSPFFPWTGLCLWSGWAALCADLCALLPESRETYCQQRSRPMKHHRTSWKYSQIHSTKT